MDHTIWKTLLTIPTAPFHEQGVSATVQEFLRKMNVPYRMDPSGNIIASLRRGRGAPPVALVAHMDHPGFEVVGKLPGPRVRARILGGVGGHLVGHSVRFFTSPETVGKIVSVERSGAHVRIQTRNPVPIGVFGSWDVPNFHLRGKKIFSPAIDDVAGVAAMLEVLNRLRLVRAPLHIYMCFTRAEEVGFIGATALAKRRVLPARTRVISIEMSRALPGRAEQGNGFVIRLGDRATLFDPRIGEWMLGAARSLKQSSPSFRYQAALLDGGTCEATLFGMMGYAAAGVALPLGNYHNRTETDGVGPEYIDRRDLGHLIQFLSYLPVHKPTPLASRSALRTRLARNFNFWKKQLANWSPPS